MDLGGRSDPAFFVHVKPPPPVATVLQLTTTNMVQVIQELEAVAKSYLTVQIAVEVASGFASPELLQTRDKLAAKLEAFRQQASSMTDSLGTSPAAIEAKGKFQAAVATVFARLAQSGFTNASDEHKASLSILRGAIGGGLGLTTPLASANKGPAGAPLSDGKDVTDDVLTFEFDEDEQKIDQCKITVNNQDLRYLDELIFQKGGILIVAWGYGGRMSTPRQVIIQKVSGGRALTIEAQGETVLMNKQVRNRTFDGLTRSQIVKLIAGENGYGPLAQDIEDVQTVRPHTLQAQLTDAQFLRRLADLEGFEFYVDGLGLHWHRRRMGQRPIRVLQYFTPPDVGDITDFSLEADVFAKVGALSLKGRDPVTKKDFVATAGSFTSGEHGALNPFTSSEHTSLGATPEIVGATPASARTGGGSGHVKIGIDPITGDFNITPDDTLASSAVSPTTAQDAAGAKALADAKHTQTQQSAIVFTVDIVGDPDLPPKTIIDVRGLGKRLSGKYYVSGHQHSIGAGKYTGKLRIRSDGTSGSALGAPVAANKTDVNTQSGTGTDSKELGTVISIDPVSGEIKTTYHDNRGRSSPGGSQPK